MTAVRRLRCVAFALILMGCSGEVDPPPVELEGHTDLESQVEDTSLVMDTRLAAAAELAGHSGGVRFIVDRHGAAPDGFSGLLLSRLQNESPQDAARLAAGMMAKAHGETKLTFSHVLLDLKQHAPLPLVDLLEGEVDWQTRIQALDVLGKLAAVEALSTVIDHLSHPNTWVRIASAHALSEMDSKDATFALVGALKDSATTVVTAALIALGKTGDFQAREACSGMLAHENPRVRGAAVSSLGRLGGPGVRESLKGMTEDPDEGVRYKAGEALRSLTR